MCYIVVHTLLYDDTFGKLASFTVLARPGSTLGFFRPTDHISSRAGDLAPIRIKINSQILDFKPHWNIHFPRSSRFPGSLSMGCISWFVLLLLAEGRNFLLFVANTHISIE